MLRETNATRVMLASVAGLHKPAHKNKEEFDCGLVRLACENAYDWLILYAKRPTKKLPCLRRMHLLR